MLIVSDALYENYRESDFFNFLFRFLGEQSNHAGFRSALANEESCRALWGPYFDPQRPKQEQALHMAFVLARQISGDPIDGPIPAEITPAMMKAELDSGGLVPFSAFDRRMG